MHNYLFDVKMFSTIRVNAKSQEEAARLICDAFDCSSFTITLGDGQSVTFEQSVDGDLDLVERDGKALT